jgi:3-oxoacyl-[acyl-carrier protein] reductase
MFLCSQLAVEHMFRKRSKGVIVNISSISRQGRAGQVSYSASKGGAASLTFTLAQELAPFGIRCVAIAPGLVATSMAEQIPEDRRKQMLSHVAVGRMGKPEEIAHGVLFCVENDFFNGRVLELDGGPLG